MPNDFKDLYDSLEGAGFSKDEILKALVAANVVEKSEVINAAGYLPEDQRDSPEMWSADFPSIMDGFFSTKGTKGPSTPDYYDLCDYLIKAKGCKSLGPYTWLYKAGKYDLLKKEKLQQIIAELTLRKASINQVNQFLNTLIAVSQVDEDALLQTEHKINMENGVYDIESGELLPHTKEFFFKYKLPIVYNPTATCPMFMDYLKQTFENDEELINVTADIFGYCLYGGEPFLHKAFVLFGEGRNGKSVWLHVLRHLLGLTNVSTVSMSLLSKPFSVIQMDGKLANIVGELPTSKLDSELFKTACGGEYLTAAHKGKDEYGLKVDARLVFATNKFPVFGDTTTGLWEKLFIIPFKRYLKPDERDPQIFDKLLTELPGIFNFALNGLKRVVETGRIIEPQAVKMAMSEYRKDSDNVFSWIENHVKITGNNTDKINSTTLYAAYQSDMIKEGRKPYGASVFGRKVNQINMENNLGITKNHSRNGSIYTGLVYKQSVNRIADVLRLNRES